MRDLTVFIFFLIFIFYFLSNCANVVPPTGGPVDTIPPILEKSVPENKSLNYDGNTVFVEYNEYLKVEDLNNQLIITPIINQEFETKIKKYSVEIIFPEPFEDSTTYTFNFQNAITDITEGNVSVDNVLAFSTGNYLDSIYITGKIINLFTDQLLEGYTVCLYNSDDTLNIFNSKPMYLTRSDESGKYLIENIKNGFYDIYAYNDLNKNLICDIPKETFGFIPDSLNLNTNIDSLTINAFYLDMRPLEIQRSSTSGKYFEIKTNKNITEYSLNAEDSTIRIYHNYGEDNKTIRVYNTFDDLDSLKFYFTAADSINQTVNDTLWLKFAETKRKKLDFNYSFSPSNGAKITDNFTGHFTSNKPILIVNTDSIYFQYDSTTFQYIEHDSILQFNDKRDEFTFSIELFYTEYLEKLSASDSTAITQDDNISRPAANVRTPTKRQNELILHLGNASVITVENDSLISNKYEYTKLNEENFGIIRGNVISEDSLFTIQLLKDKSLEVVDEIENQNNFVFNNVEPGEYRIRVFVDENANGEWDPGNIFKNLAHEKVYFLPETLSLRANWELTDINLEF